MQSPFESPVSISLIFQVSNQINENIVINHNTTNQNQQVTDNEETSIRSMAINQSKTRSLSPNLQEVVTTTFIVT